MKPNFTSQEILLVTGTTFSSRQYSKNDENGKTSNSNQEEMLQEACWNGLIGEMLPEISINDPKDPLYLWKLHVGRSFIELELGKMPEAFEHYFSINPYYLSRVQCDN